MTKLSRIKVVQRRVKDRITRTYHAIVPKKLVRSLGLKEGDEVKLVIVGKSKGVEFERSVKIRCTKRSDGSITSYYVTLPKKIVEYLGGDVEVYLKV